MQNVPQSCRSRFDNRDFDFITSVFTEYSEKGEDPLFQIAANPEMLDFLLEHPKLIEAVLAMKHPINISAELYFFVLVRHTLKERGIDHLELTDYVAATLAQFAEGNPFQTQPGDTLQVEGIPYHVEFVEAMHSASAYERFYLNVRCGNQFLVLTGIFPEFLERREQRRGAPGVRYYEGVARESFRTASTHPLADEFALGEVYEVLTNQFRQTRKALNRMADEYLFLRS